MRSIEEALPSKEPGEKIVIFIRKHWVSFLGFCLMAFTMLLILAIFVIIFYFFAPDAFYDYRGITILFCSIYALFVLGFFLVGWIDYYFDIVIITNRRILDIQQRGLFSRDIDSLDLSHVEDVSSDMTGVLPTLFQYGSLNVQTAGTAPNFKFVSIPNPQKVGRTIMDLCDQVEIDHPEKYSKINQNKPSFAHHPHTSLIREGDEANAQFPQENIEEKKSNQNDRLTNYRELLKKDQQKLNKNEGQLSEGDEVDFGKDKDKS